MLKVPYEFKVEQKKNKNKNSNEISAFFQQDETKDLRHKLARRVCSRRAASEVRASVCVCVQECVLLTKTNKENQERDSNPKRSYSKLCFVSLQLAAKSAIKKQKQIQIKTELQQRKNEKQKQQQEEQ